MRRDLIPSIAIGMVAVTAIILGLWVSGGRPLARAERHDSRRVQDIIAMSQMIRCTAGLHDNVLPKTYYIDPACDDGADHTDPVTGEPYSYVWISVQGYRICATLETTYFAETRIYGGVVSKSGNQTCSTWIYRP